MKNYLQALGASLAGKIISEDMTITTSFDDFKKDLMKKLSRGSTVSVTVTQKGQNVFEYKFNSIVKEEAVEVKPAQDVWAENKDESATYVSNTTYFVKKIEGEKYEVSTEEGTTRKQFAVLSKTDLDTSFTPIRANQTPDAEGYTQYRDTEEIEAFKSTIDTVKVDDNGSTMLLTKGDYLIRKTDGSTFKYEVKKAKDFEANYAKK